MSERVQINRDTGIFERIVPTGKGAKGQIKTAQCACFGTISVKDANDNGFKLNTGSLIEFLKTTEQGQHLKKGFLGIGRSNSTKIKAAFHSFILSVRNQEPLPVINEPVTLPVSEKAKKEAESHSYDLEGNGALFILKSLPFDQRTDLQNVNCALFELGECGDLLKKFEDHKDPKKEITVKAVFEHILEANHSQKLLHEIGARGNGEMIQNVIKTLNQILLFIKDLIGNR